MTWRISAKNRRCVGNGAVNKKTFLTAVLFVLGLALLVVFRPQSGTRQPSSVVQSSISLPEEKKSCFDPGERIEYSVYLGKIKMGSAVFEYAGKSELAGRQVEKIIFTTTLAHFYDQETILCDPSTFLPIRVERVIRAWPKYETIVEEYDQKNHTLVITKKNGKDSHSYSFQGDVHNAVLLPFHVRARPELEENLVLQVNLPTQQFEVKRSGFQDVEIKGVKIKTHYFRSSPDKFEVWISDDEHRVPVRIKGAAGIGYTMTMERYFPGKAGDERNGGQT